MAGVFSNNIVHLKSWISKIFTLKKSSKIEIFNMITQITIMYLPAYI